MLTVLHTESSSGWGGQESRTLNVCLGLRDTYGARVIILCRPGSRLAERAASCGFEVKTHPLRSSHDISAVRFTASLIRAENVDVVNTHSGTDSFVCAIGARLSGRRPLIVRTRHLALPITSKSTYSILPHRVVTVSEYVRRYLVEERGLKAERVVTVHTGIDAGRFDPESVHDGLRAELGVGEKTPLVGTVAILRRKKGHHVLLEAIPSIVERVPGVQFLFAGDGPQRENLERRINELGLGGRVIFLGLRRDVERILKAIDLFVLPTLEEALGTSILEASAMGKAVVSTDVGGVPEVVEHGRTGLLVKADDSRALAGAVTRLLGDPATRDAMGREGRRMVRERFTIEKMVEGMHDLYERLVNGKRRRMVAAEGR